MTGATQKLLSLGQNLTLQIHQSELLLLKEKNRLSIHDILLLNKNLNQLLCTLVEEGVHILYPIDLYMNGINHIIYTILNFSQKIIIFFLIFFM